MISDQERESAIYNNINEIEKILDSSSQYVNIASGEKRVLQFLPEKRITEVEKPYTGQKVKKIRFIVCDPSSGTKEEKVFDVGRRSARLIVEKLKEGYALLKIERIGSGKETIYIPTEISNTEQIV